MAAGHHVDGVPRHRDLDLGVGVADYRLTAEARRGRKTWRLVQHVLLVLFGFVYPGERARIPRRVMDTLLARLAGELDASDPDAAKLCQGTVVSRQQYLIDVQEWGYTDGRLRPRGNMTAEEIAHWTAAIGTIK
jgi:hypothetical protein